MAVQKFPKSSRLLTRADFSGLRKGAFRIRRRYLSAWVKKGTGRGMRLGISASRKVGNAVRRNRLKRIIRETFRRSDCRDLDCDALMVVSPELSKSDPVAAGAKVVKSLKEILLEIKERRQG